MATNKCVIKSAEPPTDGRFKFMIGFTSYFYLLYLHYLWVWLDHYV